MEDTKVKIDPKIEELLEEYQIQREALKGMITDLEKIKENIDTLFPDVLDKRYVRFFEEKVKTATGMFNALLDIRKEISKNLRDEIEIRFRINKAGNGNSDGILNIGDLAKKVEKLQKQKEKMEEKVEKKKETITSKISKPEPPKIRSLREGEQPPKPPLEIKIDNNVKLNVTENEDIDKLVL